MIGHAVVEFPEQNVFGELPIIPTLLARKLKMKKWSNRHGRFYPETRELFNFLNFLAKRTAKKTVTSKVVTAKGIKPYYLDKKTQQKGFVLDYLWWSEPGGTLLAAESELSDSIQGMKHDFEKLL